MTIILTDDQASKIRERLEYIDSQWFAECLTILDGAQRVEQIGIAAVSKNQGVTIGWYPNVLVTHNDKIYGVKK